MPGDFDTTPVARLAKGRDSEIVVSVGRVHGAPVIDLRTWASFGADDAAKPTKKGLCIALARLGELREALDTAERHAVASGLMGSGAHG